MAIDIYRRVRVCIVCLVCTHTYTTKKNSCAIIMCNTNVLNALFIHKYTLERDVAANPNFFSASSSSFDAERTAYQYLIWFERFLGNFQSFELAPYAPLYLPCCIQIFHLKAFWNYGKHFWPMQNIVFGTFWRPYGAALSNNPLQKLKCGNKNKKFV